MILIVNQEKQGEENCFTCIQDAVNYLRPHGLEAVTIKVAPGIYRERIMIPPHLTEINFMGSGENETIIVNGLGAKDKDTLGNPLGTFKTATVEIFSDDISFSNLTIENDVGVGEKYGQALAVAAHGERIAFENVSLIGYQDTFYSSKGTQRFLHCRIEGDVDFIFGGGSVVFEDCVIHSRRNGYITAASTPKDALSGFVFLRCELTADNEADKVYLGRPWRPYAHTVFYDCKLGRHILTAGWDNWRNEANEQTARYTEIHSHGEGASEERVPWCNNWFEKDSHLIEDYCNRLQIK
ncbi:pectinesterase family protein [Salipaludibacillus neizhouensis]|nr:pectinesterase family protein [Salipaludibacillus neizhouensis]